MTIRLASCRELASDLASLTELQKHYWILEKSATPTALLFPWFPGPAKKAKDASTKALFSMLWRYIEERRKASVSSLDGIDIMLGQGMNNEDVIQFVLSVIFAGVVNTGTNGTNPHFPSSPSRGLFFLPLPSLLDPPLHISSCPLEIFHPFRDLRVACPAYQLLRAAPQTPICNPYLRLGGCNTSPRPCYSRDHPSHR